MSTFLTRTYAATHKQKAVKGTRSPRLRVCVLFARGPYRRSGSRLRWCTLGLWGDGRHMPGSSNAYRRAQPRDYRLCSYNLDNHTCALSFSTPCGQVVSKRRACRLQAVTVAAEVEFKGQPIGNLLKFIYCSRPPRCQAVYLSARAANGHPIIIRNLRY